MASERTAERSKRLIARSLEVIEELDESLAAFDERMPFSGPAVHFHRRASELRRGRSARQLVDDVAFLEAVYATLTAWGMNSRAARLVDFDDFRSRLNGVAPDIDHLRQKTLAGIDSEAVSSLAGILGRLAVSVGESQLVSGTKTLHHFLPELLPPIDRQFTLNFLFGHGTVYDEEHVLRDVLFSFSFAARHSRFVETARRRITSGAAMDTSTSKVLDNAIIGFMLRHGPKLA